MCVRKNSLYIGLPLPSIPTELPPSPCSEKVHAFSDCHIYEYDFSKISNNYNGFTTSENALTFTIPAYKDKRSAARDGDNGVSGISNDYNGFTTSEIAPYVHFPRARGKYRRSRG